MAFHTSKNHRYLVFTEHWTILWLLQELSQPHTAREKRTAEKKKRKAAQFNTNYGLGLGRSDPNLLAGTELAQQRSDDPQWHGADEGALSRRASIGAKYRRSEENEEKNF